MSNRKKTYTEKDLETAYRAGYRFAMAKSLGTQTEAIPDVHDFILQMRDGIYREIHSKPTPINPNRNTDDYFFDLGTLN